MPKFYVTPLVHPAAIVRGAFELEPCQEAYLRRLLANPYPVLPDLTQPPPNSKLYPTIEEMYEHLETCRQLGAASFDVEACGPWPICVGVTAFSLDTGEAGPSLCARFRVRGGARYWTAWSDHVRATRWLYEFLSDTSFTKLAHNGTGFDIPELEALGFKVEGVVLDSLIMAHAAWAELPVGLAFQANLFADAMYWKHLVDQDAEEEGKG